MDEQKLKEYNSLDLTEDEDSSEGSPEIKNPIHFVDCSKSLNDEQVTLKSNIEHSATSPSKYFNFNDTKKPNVPQPPKLKTISTKVKHDMGKKVTKFTSVQIKPPRYSAQDTQDIPEGDVLNCIETVQYSSESKATALNSLPSPPVLKCDPHLLDKSSATPTPQDTASYSPKQPPGKVVMIKKNNKYYKIIIPHNVMPNINQSVGPVLINIPEVGPLVISNDPKATKVAPSQQQLSLNLDAAEPKLNCTPVMKSPTNVKWENLRDKKFCWTLNCSRKRDLDGYSITDRLGFSKSDVKKAKKCEKEINDVVAKYHSKLTKLTENHDEFKMSLLKKDEVKLVKINTILQNGGKTKEDLDEPDTNMQNIENSEQEALSPFKTKTKSDSFESGQYHSDLLVTKKVVILDKNNKAVRCKRLTNETPIRKRGRRKNVQEASKTVKDNQTKSNRKVNIKSCYVQIVKDKRVEEAYRRLSTDIREKPLKTKTQEVGLDTSTSKCTKVNSTSKNSIPNHEDVKETKEEDNVSMMLSRIIDSEEPLQQAMTIHKPILIMTEQAACINKSLEYYCGEFSRNNIIYIVSPDKVFPDSILKSEGFVSAVEIGYVKLIESNLFYKFAKNGMRVYNPDHSKHFSEHNYNFLSDTVKNKM